MCGIAGIARRRPVGVSAAPSDIAAPTGSDCTRTSESA